jgi:putative addiction module component (TIGR02574 family)
MNKSQPNFRASETGPAKDDFWLKACEPSLNLIWDNSEDDIYAELLEVSMTTSGGNVSTYEEIISAAMSLPPGPRAMLAEHLLNSLNGEDQKRIDALWADEIERRIKEVYEGKVTPIPGGQVMERLRSRHTR